MASREGSPGTLRSTLSGRLGRLNIRLASASTQHTLARIVLFIGLYFAAFVVLHSFVVPSPDYLKDQELQQMKGVFLAAVIVAVASYPSRPRVTRAAGRILGFAALVITTATLSNSFIDRLQANRHDESDAWYLASVLERDASLDFLFLTLAGGAFVLAADLKMKPVRDHRLLPPSRPRWLAWPLALLVLVVVGGLAGVLPGELVQATGQRMPLARTMGAASVLGTLGLLSPRPLLRHLGWLSIGFAAIVAATAWGQLWALRWAQRIPDEAKSDLADPMSRTLVLRTDLPENVFDATYQAQVLYQVFLFYLLIVIGLAWLHLWMRRKGRSGRLSP